MGQLDSNSIDKDNYYVFVVTEKHKGIRLDHFLANCVEIEGLSCSRAMFQQFIREKHVLVNSAARKNNYRIRTADRIELRLPPPDLIELTPEPIEFDILFEDTEIIVISKPPNLVVHPAAGNFTGTLVHGLLYHCHDLSGINGTVRPGIVHRLDKDTSGIMVVAKNDVSLQGLASQFKEKKVKKTYTALVDGTPAQKSGTIRSFIGRHHVNRKKMSVVEQSGKEAITHWKLIESLNGYSILEVSIETGRTHQIRVHLAYIGLPIVGDSVYGAQKKQALYKEMGASRQMLHSFRLSFHHPKDRQLVEFEAPLYHDMAECIDQLKRGKDKNI